MCKAPGWAAVGEYLRLHYPKLKHKNKYIFQEYNAAFDKLLDATETNVSSNEALDMLILAMQEPVSPARKAEFLGLIEKHRAKQTNPGWYSVGIYVSQNHSKLGRMTPGELKEYNQTLDKYLAEIEIDISPEEALEVLKKTMQESVDDQREKELLKLIKLQMEGNGFSTDEEEK
jgi:transcriptional regulator CtsR